MDDHYKIQICGNVSAGRTEAEICFRQGRSLEGPVALVFETIAGWQTEYLVSKVVVPESVIESARERLSHYINRIGLDQPSGLTVAGVSLWLMIKDDGTAMGKRWEQ